MQRRLRAVITALTAITMLACIAARPSGAQEATATITRRATPTFTPTRTRTIQPTITPTRPPAGTEFYLCSAGDQDGEVCDVDPDCPDGACVLTLGVCDGGSQDGTPCDDDTTCMNARCVLTQHLCIAGDGQGLPCLRDANCGTGFLCGSTGLYCYGGPYDLTSCVGDTDCQTDTDTEGICVAPEIYQCSAGDKNGTECIDHPDCPNGACVLAWRVCDGGGDDGFECSSNIHCGGGGVCRVSNRICSAGDYKTYGCLADAHCPGGSCLASGMFCNGGVFDTFSCVDNTGCELEGETPGTCEVPVPELRLCSAGPNDGLSCPGGGTDCPQGVCARTQGVCDGGANDGVPCDSDGDCGTVSCLPAYKVCTSGGGYSCLRAAQCEDSAPCASPGLICSGGPFDGFVCVDDAGCYYSGEPPGACEGIVPRQCTVENPCAIDGRATGQVFGAYNAPVPPASADYFRAVIPSGARGLAAVLRVDSGDADLYIGRTVSTNPTDYAIVSEGSGQWAEVIRLDGASDPTFDAVSQDLDAVAIAVVGFDAAPTYTLDAVFLGPSPPGDANCDGTVNQSDIDGLTAAIFDPATRLTSGGPFGRCLGADANADGAETAADFVALSEHFP